MKWGRCRNRGRQGNITFTLYLIRPSPDAHVKQEAVYIISEGVLVLMTLTSQADCLSVSQPRDQSLEQRSPSCPSLAMEPRLLLCLALCLMGAGKSWSERTSLKLVPSSVPFVYGNSMTLLLHCVSKPSTPSAGHMGALVIQNPRYLVTGMGKPVNLSCSQSMKHDVMYWYQQKPSQAPTLLLYYYDRQITREKNTSENFQSSQPNTSFCSLDIRSAGLGDSAVYLCASSRDTELNSSLPSVHKPLLPRAESPLDLPPLWQPREEVV